MRRCAFLTLSDPADYVIDDSHAYGPFERIGWTVAAIPWDQTSIPWSSFDAVVVRSTWDYQHHVDRFLEVLSDIDRSGVALFNSLELIRWNLAKTYLRDLAACGIPVVPTVFLERLDKREIPTLLDRLSSDEIVLKPMVSANAEDAHMVRTESWREQLAGLTSVYGTRPLLAQPFVRAVRGEGEYSLVYFDGGYSHGILKTPAPGDFRVQEEHGGHIRAARVPEPLVEQGRSALATLPEVPLYARVDLVSANEGDEYWLMEMELIEPSLYLRMDADAARRFAEAFGRRVERR